MRLGGGKRRRGARVIPQTYGQKICGAFRPAAAKPQRWSRWCAVPDTSAENAGRSTENQRNAGAEGSVILFRSTDLCQKNSQIRRRGRVALRLVRLEPEWSTCLLAMAKTRITLDSFEVEAGKSGPANSLDCQFWHEQSA